mgnify:FL=1
MEELMATFYNQATLSYNGNTTTSNITTGEIIEILSAAKTAVTDTYRAGGRITYIVSIVNTGDNDFTDLTVTDNLGAYTYNNTMLTPLDYVEGSIKYYMDGVLQAAPVITSTSPLTITGISVPANGNTILVYETNTNEFAPLDNASVITNTAAITGANLPAPITAVDTVEPENNAFLTISKSLTPSTVTENGQLTYTFVIQNSGNTEAGAVDNVVLTDTFLPVLKDITVTFNDVTWVEGTNYTYNATTGLFTTIGGQITVPAATYTRDATTGALIVNPGVSTLTVTGTIK